MRRRFIPLAIALVATAYLAGCKKTSDGGGSDDPAPFGPPIKIKLREDQQGDKLLITESENNTMTMKAAGPKGTVNKEKKTTEKLEHTETVLEKPAGTDRATKSSLAFTVAEKSEDGQPARPSSYAKKTLMIEKKGAVYTYTVNGVPLPEAEAKRFRDRYERAEKIRNEDMLPKKDVQVNEKWSLDPVVFKKFAASFSLPLSADKSSGTGRLTKTYTKNDQQWGTIEVNFNLVLEGKQGPATISGNFDAKMELDTAIDGSSLDGTMKQKMSGTLITKQPGNVEVEVQIQAEGEETRKTVK